MASMSGSGIFSDSESVTSGLVSRKGSPTLSRRSTTADKVYESEVKGKLKRDCIEVVAF